MKKHLSLLLALFLILSLVACSTEGVSQIDYDKVVQERDELAMKVEDLQSQIDALQNNGANGSVTTLPPPSTDGSGATPSTKPGGSFDADTIAQNLIVHQYSYTNSIKTTWVFHVVENTSEYTLEISGPLKTFDSTGNILGAKSSSEEAVGSGQKTILSYMLDEAFNNSEYEMVVSEDTWYTPVTQNLTYESSSAKNKEVITVTNNGNIAAEFVEANVLFFSGDTLVYHDSSYFTDNDSELKPGKSITKELDCRQSYDSFIVIFTGRA